MDRFTRGFVAGVLGGIIMNLWSLAIVISILNWEIIRFIDWSAIIIFGDLPRNHLEGIFGFSMHLVFTGLLGIIFAFLIPHITSRAYLFKGIVYGLIANFISYAIPGLFQKPVITEHSLATVTSNLIGAILFGIVLAQTLYWLDKKYTAI